MRLFQIISPVAVGALAVSLPFIAAAQSRTIVLDPGLYDFTHVMRVNGQEAINDDYEYCITEGRNSKTMDEIVASLVEGGQCTASGVVMTHATGRANVSCTDPDYGIKYNGVMEADYGPDHYNINTNARINGMPVTVKTRVKRRGVCPSGWDNPDGVSAD